MKPRHACHGAPLAGFALLFLFLAPAAGPLHAGTLVVIAPHPDDGEASCGGLIANAVAAGDSVVVLEMTGGELGVWGKSPEEARAIRIVEARRAAAALGARAEFFGGLDGSLVSDAAGVARLGGILAGLKPDVVVAPWPLDVHPDHQAAGQLAWRAFQDPATTFALYFYETTNSPHTRSVAFTPSDYVDITGVLERKREATLQHASQNPAVWFDMYANLALVHGYAADVAYAEAYVRARNGSGLGGRAEHTGRTLARARD
jgi:N-acetylglucosamine malate deacetylase 1